MKQSRYNFFYKLNNGQFLIYNALKNGLAVVEEDIVEKIKNVEKEENLDEELKKELIKGGFIIEDNFNEYAVLTIRRHLQQYMSNGIAMTIAPTINCNLACKYCFENPDGAVMDEKTEDKIVEYVKNELKSGKKYVSVTWYGGEPLLCMKQIESLSGKLIELCRKRRARYYADIITNGTLYTKDVAERLKKLKVARVQITLDGYKDTHDVRRPFKDRRKSSFEAIVKNLEDTVGILPVSLRINVDKENVEQAVQFVKDLKSKPWFDPNYIYPYFGYVRKYTASCRCSEDECLLPGEFWQKSFELQQYLVENEIASPEYPDISSGCGATSIHSYVIGPKGELYKCWNHLGEKNQVVGYIDKEIDLNPLYTEYLYESFETDEECRKCKYLPICMGGCVDIMIKAKRGEMPSKDCTKWKEYLEKQLKLFYEYKLTHPEEKSCKVR